VHLREGKSARSLQEGRVEKDRKMKNLIQMMILPGMVGLASLVSGCSVSHVEESKVSDTLRNSEPQELVEYEFLCDPEVELSDGEVKMKYILKGTRTGEDYPLVDYRPVGEFFWLPTNSYGKIYGSNQNLD